MSRATRFSLTALGSLIALTAPAAPAQEATSAGSLLQEIVVTAQRREEQVQDVPIAISAFSDAQLEQLAVTETLGIVKLIPNLLGFNNTGLGTANGYYMRGLGNTESIATFDPPVGTYVDEVFISRQNANNLGLFDVDRLEVLRGPQGALFGRNTTGGAINVILRKPAQEFGGYLEAGFGQFGAWNVRGSADLPVSDSFLTKVSVYATQDDGYVSNPVTGEDDLNAAESLGARLAARWLISDSLTWDLAAQYTKDEGANLLNFELGGPQLAADSPAAIASVAQRCRGVVTKSRFYCTGLRQTGTPLAGLLVNEKASLPLGNEVENWMFTSNIGWDTSVGTVNFITGYVDLHQEFALDFFNGTPAPFVGAAAGGFTIANVGDHRQVSQEIKLTGDLTDNIRYVAGVYYFREKNETDFGDIFGLGAVTLVLEDRILKNEAEAWAAYTQWDFTFADAWTLTLGGRFTDESKEIDFIANANPMLGAPTSANRVNSANIAAAGIPLEQSTSLFTPRVALKWDISNDVNVFASATRGFKSGGWNARATGAGAPSLILPFDPEIAWSYELGLRSEWLDRRLRLNLTAFQLDVEALQTPSAFTNPTTGAITFITRNFSDLENKGIEAELIFSPIDDLTLFAFAGFQDAEYTNIAASIRQQQAICLAALAMGASTQCSQGIVNNLGGIAPPVRTPDTLTLGGNYTFRFGDSLALTPNITWTRFSDYNVGTNGSPVALVDGTDTFDAGVTLAADAGWSVQAFCRNCNNEVQIVSTLSELPYVQDPRTWGVNFKYNFGVRK